MIETRIGVLEEVRTFVNNLDEPSPPRKWCDCCESTTYMHEGQCFRDICEARRLLAPNHCCNNSCHPERWHKR